MYESHSCVRDVGSIHVSFNDAVGLGINGIGNRSYGSEQEKGNLGDLHGERLRAVIETIGKMDQIITGGTGLDELDIL